MVLLPPVVWAFIRCRVITPTADFCRPVRMDRSTLSPDSGTGGRFPEVSSTVFRTQPPDLQPVPLMDMGSAVSSPLAQHRMPLIRFFVHLARTFAPRFLRAQAHDDALALRYCFTSIGELSNMLAIPQKRAASFPAALVSLTASERKEITVAGGQEEVRQRRSLRLR